MTQEQVDAISDEFGSTFTLIKGDLFNMIFPRDTDRVEGIIKKQIPGTKSVIFDAVDEISEGYFMYRIEVRK